MDVTRDYTPTAEMYDYDFRTGGHAQAVTRKGIIRKVFLYEGALVIRTGRDDRTAGTMFVRDIETDVVTEVAVKDFNTGAQVCL